MGNKSSKRERIEEQYTKPQGLYTHPCLDKGKLRKLILNKKLAPCYPGQDEPSKELEDCPICTLSYPSLNRSKCCRAAICTECFLNLKSPDSDNPVRCPFCNTHFYAVDYLGPKSVEEREAEEAEEQKVLEAQIRQRREAAGFQPIDEGGDSDPDTTEGPNLGAEDHFRMSNLPPPTPARRPTLASTPPTPLHPMANNSRQSDRRRFRLPSLRQSSGVQVEELVNRRQGRGRSRSEDVLYASWPPAELEQMTRHPLERSMAEGAEVENRVSANNPPVQESDDEIDTEILRLALWESIREREAQLYRQHSSLARSLETYRPMGLSPLHRDPPRTPPHPSSWVASSPLRLFQRSPARFLPSESRSPWEERPSGEDGSRTGRALAAALMAGQEVRRMAPRQELAHPPVRDRGERGERGGGGGGGETRGEGGRTPSRSDVNGLTFEEQLDYAMALSLADS